MTLRTNADDCPNIVEIVTEYGTALIADPSWDALVDTAGTPFHGSRFLLPWWEDAQTKNPASRLIAVKAVDGSQTVGVCAFELCDGALSFAGGRDLVDYMGPVAAGGREEEFAEALTRWLFGEAEWTTARLGGLVPTETAAAALIGTVQRQHAACQIETYDQAPGIDAAPEGYFALLNSKRRHEALRKRNRLTEEVGELHLDVSTPETLPDMLERLLEWKAAVGSATSNFVDEYGTVMRNLLGGLAAARIGHVVELRAGDRPLASAIVLEHRDTTYLYNMAYDLTLTSDAGVGLAPGVVLVTHLAEQALEADRRFDFLKGAQDYKRRLGGVPRDLVALVAER